MKLELNKNIIQYIANGVEIEILNYKSDYVGIKTAKANGFYYVGDDLYIIYEGGSTGKRPGKECLLHLYPLSYLTKYIDCNEVMGEKFIPLDYLNSYAFKNLLTPPDIDIIKDVLDCEYWIIEKLFEWHFDFKLIENGLAVNINTIK